MFHVEQFYRERSLSGKKRKGKRQNVPRGTKEKVG